MEIISPFYFYPQLILRTPRLPFLKTISVKDIQQLLYDPIFLESIYLASPVLYQECIKWKENSFETFKGDGKIIHAIAKYFLRSATRCTPFGLFSGSAVVDWNPTSFLQKLERDGIGRHTRLDMHYLCKLGKKLMDVPTIKEHLHYFPNNSIYQIGNEFRYVEYIYERDARNYQISSVQKEDYILAVLANAEDGKTKSKLAKILIDGHTIEQAEALDFIDELISAQLLVSELEPCITGEEYLSKMIKILERIVGLNNDENIVFFTKTLLHIKCLLENLDTPPYNKIEKYKDIIGLLERFDVEYDESKVFQVDATNIVNGAGIDINIQGRLHDTLNVLNKLRRQSKSNPNLQAFAKRFHDRYEDKEMPLLQVLDTETGIGYLDNKRGHISPLIDNLIITNKKLEQGFVWTETDILLNEKLQSYLVSPETGYINICDEDLRSFKSNWDALPPSMSIMFRLVEDKGEQIYVENVGGSSGVNLLSRFAHADAGINKIAHEVASNEQANNEGVVFAEIVHLPQSRTANVLLHPAFRDYEIPYLAQSSLAKDNQIDMSDLYISVNDGHIFLRSKKLNKQVVPRLSSAHNFSFNSLPAYQFLCDMQTQGYMGNMGFDWGSLQKIYTTFPRVMYKTAILSLATWNLTDKSVKQLIGKTGEVLANDVSAFRKAHNLPQYLILADGDNELPIDMDNELTVSIWLNAVKNRSHFTLKEFLQPTSTITDNDGRPYVNQFITTVIRNSPAHTSIPMFANIDSGTSEIKQAFVLGSEWLYYKLYCGIKTADKLLLEAVKPLAEELLEKGIIDKWFFIRYTDPEFHIRLRFHLPDVSKIGELIQMASGSFQEYINEGFIWDCRADTYVRELQRYGSNAIDIAETFFFHDSNAVLWMLDNTDGDARENVRWLWAIRSIDEFLNCFDFSMRDKVSLMASLRDSFSLEHGMDKYSTMQVNDKYRFYRKEIAQMMDRNNDQSNDKFPIIEILYKKNEQLRDVALQLSYLYANGKLRLAIDDIIKSYIHMMLNRIIASDQRLHEMVIYHFVSKHYESEMAKKKMISAPLTTTA